LCDSGESHYLEPEALTPETELIEPGLWRDNKDRQWLIELDYALCKRIKSETRIDLPGSMDGQAWFTLQSSIEKLVEVLWVCCEEQADQAGVDETSFGKGLGGDAIDRARAALERAWLLFCPAAQRRLAQHILAQIQATRELELTAAIEEMNGPSAKNLVSKSIDKARKQVRQEMDRMAALDPPRRTPSARPFGTSDSSGLPSPESSPGDTR
jgi:hypothetical protein